MSLIIMNRHLENTYALVQKETRRQSGSRIDSASRLLDLIDEYEGKFASLVEEAMVSLFNTSYMTAIC